MPHTFNLLSKKHALLFEEFFQPAKDAMIGMSPLVTRGSRPLQISFEDHFKALVFNLEEAHICTTSSTSGT